MLYYYGDYGWSLLRSHCVWDGDKDFIIYVKWLPRGILFLILIRGVLPFGMFEIAVNLIAFHTPFIMHSNNLNIHFCCNYS